MIRLLKTAAMTSILLVSLVSPIAAAPEQPCEVVPMPCTFEGLPFKITVIDAETRKPLADVHALAEWQIHGAGGRLNGPLMVLDAASGLDGTLAFPGWGPIDGPVTGLGIGRDPVITLFKSGYKALVINNADPPGTPETQRVRKFYQGGRTYELEPFRGSPDQWLEQLREVVLGLAVPRSDESTLRFRNAYLNRLMLVSSERTKLPVEHQRPGNFFWHVDRSLKLLEEGHR
ncbi:MAG: hypothetical protein DMD89_37735 [Candidatus Rokuibacteriota bacterium]|nr:MAG: hypothetical protein DMD89_37735 [Candidatus Rokubacteria bacterium]